MLSYSCNDTNERVRFLTNPPPFTPPKKKTSFLGYFREFLSLPDLPQLYFQKSASVIFFKLVCYFSKNVREKFNRTSSYFCGIAKYVRILDLIYLSIKFFYKKKKKKKLYGPFLWMGFNCLKARATSRRFHKLKCNQRKTFRRSHSNYLGTCRKKSLK